MTHLFPLLMVTHGHGDPAIDLQHFAAYLTQRHRTLSFTAGLFPLAVRSLLFSTKSYVS